MCHPLPVRPWGFRKVDNATKIRSFRFIAKRRNAKNRWKCPALRAFFCLMPQTVVFTGRLLESPLRCAVYARARPSGPCDGGESARPSGSSISNLWQYCHYFEIAGPVLGFFRTFVFQKTGCDSHKFEIERPRRGGHHDHEHLRLSARRAFARLVGPPPAGRWRARAGLCGGADAGRRGVCAIWQSVKADGHVRAQNRDFFVRPCGFFVRPCGRCADPSHGFRVPSHGSAVPWDGFFD